MAPKAPVARAARRAMAAMLGCMALAAAAQAQPATAHATRQGQAVQQQEDELLLAMARKDRAQIERLLADDFEMVVAQEPGKPIDREAWIASVSGAGGNWQIEQFTAQDRGELAIASFLLRPAAAAMPTRPAVFVVDTWQRDGAQWRLLSRHAALALGPRRVIPGDAPTRNAPKKY